MKHRGPTKCPTAVILRARRFIQIDGRKIDVVEEHNSIQKKSGAVALAKFGQSPGLARFSLIADSLGATKRPQLFLVSKQDGVFASYAADIKAVSSAYSSASAPARHPDYYDELGMIPSVWFVLSSPLKPKSLKGLRLTSNGRPVEQVVAECRTTMMLVST